MRIPLSRGLFAVVDAADHERVVAAGSWYASTDCQTHYAKRNEWYVDDNGDRRCRSIKLHKFLTGWDLVDHINGDGLDNRRANLRPATSLQNSMNRRTRSDSKSGIKGVRQNRSGTWSATIQIDGKPLALGSYKTAAEAGRAYDAAAIEHFGEFARLNFPHEGEQAA